MFETMLHTICAYGKAKKKKKKKQANHVVQLPAFWWFKNGRLGYGVEGGMVVHGTVQKEDR